MKLKFIIVFILTLGSFFASSQIYPDRYQLIGSVRATDDDNDELGWSITAGNTDKFFIITPCSGVIKVDTIAYNSFLRQRTWTITIRATDPYNAIDISKRKVILKKSATGVHLPPYLSNEL